MSNFMTATPRENLFALIEGERPEQTPFLIWDNKIPDAATARQLLDLGACIVVKSSVYKTRLRSVRKHEFSWEEEGHRFLRTVYETPYGNLTDISLVSSGSLWHQKPVFESPDDYDRLFALVSDYEYSLAFEAFLADDSRYGPSGLARPATEKSPMFEILYDYMGIANFAIEWQERRDRVVRLFDMLLQKRRERLEIVRRSPARFVIVDGNIEMRVVGEERFNAFYAPVISEATEILQADGKKSGLHLDGDNRPLIEAVSRLSIDLIESFTPPPDCDMSLPEALDLWPSKRFLVNIPSSVHLSGASAVQRMATDLALQARASRRAAIGIIEDVPLNDHLCLAADAVRQTGCGRSPRVQDRQLD
ncbi:MAG TPA: hypothetical protein PLP42_02505 [Acidobacteriota bacterium]|jgi:hypothetical protein|nr:hypothetical protein [Acidobacteriota bacterium]